MQDQFNHSDYITILLQLPVCVPCSHVRYHSKLDSAVHIWLYCHGDSEYDQLWLCGKYVSTKQLVTLHEQPAGLIPIPKPIHVHTAKQYYAGRVATHNKCFSLSRTLKFLRNNFLGRCWGKILLTTEEYVLSLVNLQLPMCLTTSRKAQQTHTPIQPAPNRRAGNVTTTILQRNKIISDVVYMYSDIRQLSSSIYDALTLVKVFSFILISYSILDPL